MYLGRPGAPDSDEVAAPPPPVTAVAVAAVVGFAPVVSAAAAAALDVDLLCGHAEGHRALVGQAPVVRTLDLG